MSYDTRFCQSWSSSHCPVQLCLPTCPHVFLGRQVTAPCSFVSQHALMSFLVVKSLPRAALSPNMPSCLSWSSSHCPVQLCLPTCPLVFLGRQVTAPSSFVSQHALLSFLVVKSLPRAALSPNMPSCLSWSSSHCPVQLCLPTCPLVFLGRQVTGSWLGTVVTVCCRHDLMQQAVIWRVSQHGVPGYGHCCAQATSRSHM